MSVIRSLRLPAFALLSAAIARAATYDVGLPDTPLQKLSAVSWSALQPGDIVNIHAKPGGYHEIIQVSASGTAAQPILIRGIPDPVTNALPIIDGANAVIDPHVDFRNTVFENLGVIIVTPRKQGYVYGKTFPSYITFESLAIRNALYNAAGANQFTDQHGVARIYSGFACGIYIEFAHHLTVRGCEISFNGNGIFANSKFGPAASSADLLFEKNYFHDNGQPTIPGISNGYGEHHLYIESVGAVYQYNRFGPLRPACRGCMIKDRSSGTVIRYNSVVSTDASEIFAVLDPQGGSGWIDIQPDYLDAFIYGNVITLASSGGGGGGNLAWFGAVNGAAFYQKQHRGTLYYYHNTVVNHRSTVAAFFLPDPASAGTNALYEKIDARNNIFYTDTAINANIYQAFFIALTSASPTIDLGMNWVSPGTRKDWFGHPSGSTINGWSNLIVGDFAGKNDAGLTSLAALDYHLTSGSDAIDAAGPLAPAAIAKGYTVDREYVAHQASIARTVLGANADLGGFETSALYVPPVIPPLTNHAPITWPQSFNVIGSAPVAITLVATDADGDPLTYAYSASGVVGSVTGTAPTLTYTPPLTGSGTMIVGYNANDGKITSAPGYSYISFNPAGNPPPSSHSSHLPLISSSPSRPPSRSPPPRATPTGSRKWSSTSARRSSAPPWPRPTPATGAPPPPAVTKSSPKPTTT